jgi:hypothetical protein
VPSREFLVEMLNHLVATVISATLDHRIGEFISEYRFKVQDDLDGMV